MAQAIKGKVPVLLKVAFELRYRQGFTYLDRCGRTINLIQEYYPTWFIPAQQGPNPQSSTLINYDTGAKFSFGSLKLDAALDRPMRDNDLDDSKIAEFSASIDSLSSIIIDQLGLAEFPRIGCRVWYIFPAKTKIEAQAFIDSLGWYSISPILVAAFGDKITSSTVGVTIEGADRKFRFGADVSERTIEVDLGDAVVTVPIHQLPTERNARNISQRTQALHDQQRALSRAQKHPPFAAMIDVDAFRDDPESVKVAEFITTSLEFAIKALRAAAD